MFSFLIKYEINGANVNHPTSCISAVCFIAGEKKHPKSCLERREKHKRRKQGNQINNMLHVHPNTIMLDYDNNVLQ